MINKTLRARVKLLKHINLNALVGALVCTICCLSAAFWFWALVLTIRPEAVITQWEQNNTEQINEDLAFSMIERLNTSITINHFDANSHFLLARYYELLAIKEPGLFFELAERAYNVALLHQPSWEYAWARLANFYSMQAQLDEVSFMFSLSNAIALGPYEAKSQIITIPLFFKHWQTLSKYKDQMMKAEKIISHALKLNVNAHYTIDAAKQYRRLVELKPLLLKPWQETKLKRLLNEDLHDENK